MHDIVLTIRIDHFHRFSQEYTEGKVLLGRMMFPKGID